jgi:hypothetical protein
MAMNMLHRDLLRALKPISLACLTAWAVITQANFASAKIVGYAFTGEVTSLSPSSSKPFGLTIPSGSAIAGQFLFDTSSAVEDLSGDASYPQSIAHGFSATFAGFPVSISDYRVIVSNREAPDLADFVTIRFSTFVAPANDATEFYVNNTHQTAGTFSLQLSGGVNSLSNGDLPSPATLLTMTDPSVSFLTSSRSFLGARFQVNTLTQISVPEPQSLCMMLAGVALLPIIGRRRFNYKR